ncbi:TMEM175 family protein [Gordonia alkaliphila]|uniref:TMEM175 family protein n=1 Tax=Gordonia alkaliphila TaxID=1053547 RepID=UPI001FF2B5CC|nr:TMEM175 family protein [Gordonia alkaliphila]MCK0439878.1 TMEM175 family protein [Gordonia alkaliphila]
MAEIGVRRTREGFARLITFADAVVAIALTLLVLPLTDLANEGAENAGFTSFVAENYPVMLSFAISFAVIWVLWRNHHRIMEHFVAYDDVLAKLHLVWLATIIVLPFATALLDNSRMQWSNVFYIAVLGVSIISLRGIARWGIAHPALLDDDADTRAWAAQPSDYGTLIAVAAALIVAIVVPQADAWPLLLLLLSSPIDALINRFRH